MRPLPLLIALAACQSAQDDDPIEITGYLDAGRIAATEAGDPGTGAAVLAVFGEAGAVTGTEELLLSNPRTGEETAVLVGPDGDFAASVAGGVGDALSLEVAGVGSIDLPVPAALDFPQTVSLIPHQPDADGLAAFSMELAAAGHLEFVLASPSRSQTAPLARIDVDGLLWSGEIPAHAGDSVWLCGLDPDRTPTRALVLTVP